MKTDQFGVQFSDDGKTLLRFTKNIEGEYVIPDGVTHVAERAFANISIDFLVVPASVQSIGTHAFVNCHVNDWKVQGGRICDLVEWKTNVSPELIKELLEKNLMCYLVGGLIPNNQLMDRDSDVIETFWDVIPAKANATAIKEVLSHSDLPDSPNEEWSSDALELEWPNEHQKEFLIHKLDDSLDWLNWLCDQCDPYKE